MWTHHTYSEGGEIELASLDLHISVDTLYESLRIPLMSDYEGLLVPTAPEDERCEGVPGDF